MVTDEVYEHLTFDDHQHVPIATLPGMFERTVTISSSGKTFSFTGWKIGWATGPADLVAAVEGAKNWLSYSSGAPFQPAIAHALDHEDGLPRAAARRPARAARLPLRRPRRARAGGARPAGHLLRRPPTSRSLGTPTARRFCTAPGRAGQGGGDPHQVFYEDGSDEGRHLVRWAFCKEQDVLDEGIRRLRAADLHA